LKIQIDVELKAYATDKQKEYIDAINECGSNRKAAKKLGINPAGIDQGMKSVRKKAALAGYSPEHDMTRTVPSPFVVKGISTYYNAEGKPSGQWVKSQVDADKREQFMLEAIEALKEDIPRLDATLPPPLGNDKLLNCYVITDYHMGMLAWDEECGENWDLKIAEELIVKWFAQAIHQSPDADTAIFAQLSDFLHFDGMDAVTPASKHLLDVDSRFSKLVRASIRILRQVITMLLQKHQKLHIIMADANHDPVSQIWLREWFSVLYENEPRVSVDTSPNPYNAYEFGKTALFFHHGHKRNVANVAHVFASQFREMFGRTKYAYAHMGHLHHVDVKENNLMIVEQHRTLAANDAYGARGGYLSGRDAKVITYSKDFGEVSRLTINSDMLA
jgi:DNA-binding transcriptional regulator YdaS (Cro superfamily)